MRLRSLLLAFFVVSLPMFGANVSGKWVFTRQAAVGGRGAPPTMVTLNQVGNDLSGRITPPRGNSTGSPANLEIQAGKVEGEAVSFYLWTGLDKPVKNFYAGKVNGDEIVFTVTVDPAGQSGGNAPGSFQVVAKRAR